MGYKIMRLWVLCKLENLWIRCEWWREKLGATGENAVELLKMQHYHDSYQK
jgi:hypothetical protein